jgi:uncharacterized protein YbjT (DUF2867 family)
MTRPILITGGTGTLGKLVVTRLVADHPLRVLSRGRKAPIADVEHVTADLITGQGIRDAMAGIRTVIHLAGGPKGDDVAARHLMQAASAADVEHVVSISIVGADRMPLGYFKAKHEMEQTLAASGVGWSLVRSAQFHELCLDLAMKLARLPVVPDPKGLRFQPVAAAEVADRIVELALGHPSGRVGELVGPTTYATSELVRTALAPHGKHRLFLPVRIPGKAGRAYRAGLNLSHTTSGVTQTWEAFLAQLHTAPAASVRAHR